MGLHPENYEKLGAFYLGRPYDLQARSAVDAPLLYDSKDLTTHAVCVGMTGSGKTGLCISLLEEAAIDGIPALVIDPKGDLANLALMFPELQPSDFRPWVSADEARRKGVDEDAFAGQQAELWRTGLAAWGQDGDRIRRLLDACEVKLFTPGSTAGEPVSIVSSFAAPGPEIRDDPELLAERIDTTVSGILGLAGVGPDGREATLVAAILQQAWASGEALSLIELVKRIQKPPFETVGVLDVESFFPEKDRFQLVLAFNNLIASPSFAVWNSGVPLDVDSLLFNAAGKPRLAVLSIAHLSDAERMFFVSLLLNAVVSWMRSQAGTASLRAILYMDEVFGYFPPTANPPSKKPLLTLLKQARAYGLGVVLATQNPADLDYKGLSNAGTWLIGRLQTERDKLRLLDGLVGAGSGMNRREVETALAGLGKRVFLMNNVHEADPVIFESRWAMSYLCGPLTRDQIRTLAKSSSDVGSPDSQSRFVPEMPVAAPADGTNSGSPAPPIIEGVRQIFKRGGAGTYHPALLVSASLRYRERTSKLDETRDEIFIATIHDGLGDLNWQIPKSVSLEDFSLDAPRGITFTTLPAAAMRKSNYSGWSKDFSAWAFARRRLQLFRCDRADLVSAPGETEPEFRIRLAHRYRELRDDMTEKLRARFAKKFETLAGQEARAHEALQKAESRAGHERVQTVMSVGATVLGALLGRKAISTTTLGRATTAARGAGRSARAGESAAIARSKLAAVLEKRTALENEFHKELADLGNQLDAMTAEIETTEAAPMKTGIRIREIALAWVPESDHAALES